MYFNEAHSMRFLNSITFYSIFFMNINVLFLLKNMVRIYASGKLSRCQVWSERTLIKYRNILRYYIYILYFYFLCWK